MKKLPPGEVENTLRPGIFLPYHRQPNGHFGRANVLGIGGKGKHPSVKKHIADIGTVRQEIVCRKISNGVVALHHAVGCVFTANQIGQ